MNKVLAKFRTGLYDYKIVYQDFRTRQKPHTIELGYGKTLECKGYDGAVGFDRMMGDLHWSDKMDKELIEKVKEKFNISQVTWNFHHNGFSADYVTRKQAKEIAKYLEGQLKYYYYKKRKKNNYA